MSLVGFQASEIWMVFLENLLQSKFSGKNNSLRSPVLGFYDSLPYDLEKSKELKALISWFLGL